MSNSRYVSCVFNSELFIDSRTCGVPNPIPEWIEDVEEHVKQKKNGGIGFGHDQGYEEESEGNLHGEG